MKNAAFAPAHITGFFAIRPDHDPLKAGSVGCGLCLEAGVTARVETDPSNSTPVIRYNGKQLDFPTVDYVINILAGAEKSQLVIDLVSDVPPGYGFGVSGAAALASAFAIQSTLKLGLDNRQLAAAAHTAEVVNKTGMGDVVGQCTGGVVIRTKPGAPGIGAVEKIPAGPVEISWVCLGEISTESILKDESRLVHINKMGEEALKSLIRHPELENFMSLSKEFAVKTGLISSPALEAIEAVEAQGGMAGVAMLGDTVFAVGCGRVLSEFGTTGSSRISLHGAQLL